MNHYYCYLRDLEKSIKEPDSAEHAFSLADQCYDIQCKLNKIIDAIALDSEAMTHIVTDLEECRDEAERLSDLAYTNGKAIESDESDYVSYQDYERAVYRQSVL